MQVPNNPTPRNLSIWALSGLLALALTAGCDADEASPPDTTTGVDADATADAAADTDSAVALPDAATGDTEADVGSPVPLPAEPTALNRCGLVFGWLERSQVGGVVSWEENALSNLPKEAISTLIGQTGYKGLAEPLYGARTFALRYTTQDRGQVVQATAMVGVPQGWQGTAAPPILVWAHGTTGFMDDCAPSKDDLQGPGIVALLASFGFVVVSPDYIGLSGFGPPSPAGNIHPYMVGEAVAVGLLDAVRASQVALQQDPALQVGDDQQLVLLGGSQGGHAVLFADRMLPYYAPELAHVATVAIVPPTDLYDHALYGLSTFGPTTGALAAAMVAMHKWYGLTAPLTDLLTPTMAVLLPDTMSSTCDVADIVDDEVLTGPADIYSASFLQAMQAEDWTGLEAFACLLTENSLHRLQWPRLRDVPVLTTYGELDNLVITALQRTDTARLCQQGYRIEYLECAGKGHTPGASASLPYAMAWLQDRVAGKPLDTSKNCVVSPPVACGQ